MKQDIFTVLDMCVGRYLEPFFQTNSNEALRSFGAICAKEGHQFNMHAEDYALYHIGTYDPESGMILPLEPRKLANASDFIAKGPQPVENIANA